MDDALLAGRAAAGDLDSFGQLYDSYVGAVYDFSWRVLGDAEAAAGATRDVFAQVMHHLPARPKGVSARGWIFGLAHTAAVEGADRSGRVTPDAGHEEAYGSFDVPDPSRLDDAQPPPDATEIAPFVWEAMLALNARDYALLDLHLRQHLDSAELAHILGASKGNTRTLVNRMERAAADAVRTYIVARRGGERCEQLRQVLVDSGFPPYFDDVRHAVDAHVDRCDVCRRTRDSVTAPMDVFASFAAVPAPLALKGELWGDLAAEWPYGGGDPRISAPIPVRTPAAVPAERTFNARVLAASSGGAGAGAMALPTGGEGGGENRIILFAAAALGLLVIAFAVAGGVMLAKGGGDDSTGVGAAGTKTAVGSSPVTPGVLVESPTAGVSPSATATQPTATTVPPTSTPVPPTAVPTEPPTSTPAPPTATPRRGGATPTRRTPTPVKTP